MHLYFVFDMWSCGQALDFCVSEHHCLRRSVLVLSCVDHVLVWRVGLEVMCHSNACLWGKV